MRIPEKTIELNFCAELSALWAQAGYSALWFGPTQKQEAKLGFDAARKVNGRLYLFQFKASCHVLSGGERRFHAPHDQMVLLQRAVRHSMRSVFYVFPTVGTTAELSASPSVLNNSLLMDVHDLPAIIPLPTGRSGALRKSNCHYVDVDPSRLIATIHSDPFTVKLARPDFDLVKSFRDGGLSFSDVDGGKSSRLIKPESAFGANRELGLKLQCAVVFPRISENHVPH
jgi:hypothetical protein